MKSSTNATVDALASYRGTAGYDALNPYVPGSAEPLVDGVYSRRVVDVRVVVLRRAHPYWVFGRNNDTAICRVRQGLAGLILCKNEANVPARGLKFLRKDTLHSRKPSTMGGQTGSRLALLRMCKSQVLFPCMRHMTSSQQHVAYPAVASSCLFGFSFGISTPA